MPLSVVIIGFPPPTRTRFRSRNRNSCVIFFLPLLLSLLTLTLVPKVGFAAGFGVTPADQFSTLEGFQVELIYEVPSETEGSWVSLTVDPKGRLIACDQYGGLYRIDVSGEKAKVEKLTVDIEGAQGLLVRIRRSVRQRQFAAMALPVSGD